MRWRFLSVVVFMLNASLTGVAIYLWHYAGLPSAHIVDRTTYLDLSLSILNAMIGLLAILLAIAALWGYVALKEAALLRAE